MGNKGGYHQHDSRQRHHRGSAGALPAGFTADSPWPDNLQGQLVFGASQLDRSGFTNITLKSVNDIVMESGSLIGPSLGQACHARSSNGTSSTHVVQNQGFRRLSQRIAGAIVDYPGHYRGKLHHPDRRHSFPRPHLRHGTAAARLPE